MNPFADHPNRSGLRFLLDAAFFKNMPPSSALVAAYDTWKNYMLMPDGQIRDAAQPRIYRTAPNGNLSAFTDIAGAMHRKLAGIELQGEKINLKHVPRAVAASISRRSSSGR